MDEPNLEVERTSDTTLDENKDPKFGDKKSKPGPLMDPIKTPEDERKVAEYALKLWESQDEIMYGPEAQWKVNAARRKGVTNAKVVWSSIDDHWTAWMPKNASPDVTPDVNKAASLCRKKTSLLFADPPISEAVPPSGDDDDVATTEFTQRVLDDIQGEGGLNSARKARHAYDKSHTFGSGYERFYIDQKGGGRHPVEIQAHPDALTADMALIDPSTGQEQGPYETRYVTPDGTLTDNREDAAMRWAPSVKSEVLDGRHVRLMPHNCDSVEDAHGVQVATFMTWGRIKKMAPRITELSKEQRSKLFQYRPDNFEDLMPGGKRADQRSKNAKHQDERLIFTLTTYYLASEEYEKGVYAITLGDQFVLHRSEWYDKENARPLDIPVSHYQGLKEGRDGYWRVGDMELLGGGNEIRAAQMSAMLDHLEKFGRRKIFLPTNSTVTPEQLRNPRATVLPVNPGSEPRYEEIPQFEQTSLDMFGIMSAEMDETSMLQEASSATKDPNVKSGRHAFAIISQVHAGLSEARENIEIGFVRGSRIALQLVRAFFDVPRELKWEGEDGQYRHRAWTRADLTSTVDVRLKPGTLSMLAPAAKAQLAERYAQFGEAVLPMDEFRDIVASNLGGTIGLQDNPFRKRIKNQIAEWFEGPPDGWRENVQGPTMFGAAPPELPPVIQQEPPTPQNPQPQPTIADPVLAELLEPTPSDELPRVANMRMMEIAKAMANPKYLKKPPDWRAGLDLEYQRMVMVAQQMAMAAQPQAQPTSTPEEPGGLKHDLQEDALQEGAPPELIA